MKLIIYPLFICLLMPLVKAENVIINAQGEHDGKNVVIEIELDKRELKVSESLKMSIRVKYPDTLTLDMPSEEELGLSYEFSTRTLRFRPTDIKEKNDIKTNDGMILKEKEYILEPWLSGNYAIPPILFSFFEVENKSKPILNLFTEAKRVEVLALDEHTKQFAKNFKQSDLNQVLLKKRERTQQDKSTEELKREKQRVEEEKKIFQQGGFPWWFLWTIIAIIICGVLYHYFGKQALVKILNKKKRPAHEMALEALEQLLKRNLLEEKKIKEFFYELSYILRIYIGNRYQIYAVNQTTEEFLQALEQKNPFDRNSEKVLIEFNENADDNKYSQHTCNDEQAMKNYRYVQEFIETTKLVEEAAEK